MLKQLFNVGIQAVLGANCVAAAINARPILKPVHVLAIGKAAASMFDGLREKDTEIEAALLITKHGHADGITFNPHVEIIESAHPEPDQSSLIAGQKALDWVKSRPQGSTLLFLVSGGASALAEVLIDGITLDQLSTMTKNALTSGLAIGDINQRRMEMSAIKGGKLLAYFPGKRATVLYISDVEGDHIGIVGSGIGACPLPPNFEYECQLVASNEIARNEIAKAAKNMGLEVIENANLLFDDVEILAPRLAQRVLEGQNGLYIWGGESTVKLPPNPGLGGRNQCLGLMFAKEIAGHSGITGLFAGTDGTDGPTINAGALVNGKTFTAQPGAQAALEAANSGAYLQACKAIVRTGPTGTNVMDLALIHKE